jgi:hypothetical protein
MEHIESTGIQARRKRAERMNMDYIIQTYNKKVKDMTAGEAEILEFFFRYHPDPFNAISEQENSDRLPKG